MRHAHNKPTAEALSPHPRDSPAGESGTYTHQKRFAQQARGILGSIKQDVREARKKASQEQPPNQPYSGVPPLTAVASTAFVAYIGQRLSRDFLQTFTPEIQYIRAGYAQGIRFANQRIREIDPDLIPDGGGDIASILQQPNHLRQLDVLNERTYSNLQDVTTDMGEAIREELIQGVNQGENPTKIANRINDRIDSIGKHRSTLIARSEVMNAHSEATLRRYEDIAQGMDEPISTLHGAWFTSLDEDVCAFCRRVGDLEFSISEMRGTTVQFRGQIYRLKPPAHPQGRCTILPSIGGITEPLAERLPAEITIVT